MTFREQVSRVYTDKRRWKTGEWTSILCWWVYICRRLDWYDETEVTLFHYAPDMGRIRT